MDLSIKDFSRRSRFFCFTAKTSAWLSSGEALCCFTNDSLGILLDLWMKLHCTTINRQMKEKDKHLMLFYKSNNYEWLWLIIPAGVESSVVFLLIFWSGGKKQRGFFSAYAVIMWSFFHPEKKTSENWPFFFRRKKKGEKYFNLDVGTTSHRWFQS